MDPVLFVQIAIAPILAISFRVRRSSPIIVRSDWDALCRTTYSSPRCALDFWRHGSHQSSRGKSQRQGSAVERLCLTAEAEPSLRTIKTGRSEAVPRTIPLRPSSAERLRRFDSAIPRSGCVPAEPASASPSEANLPRTHCFHKDIQKQQAPPVHGRVGPAVS